MASNEALQHHQLLLSDRAVAAHFLASPEHQQQVMSSLFKFPPGVVESSILLSQVAFEAAAMDREETKKSSTACIA
jgi:hypothetical protein